MADAGEAADEAENDDEFCFEFCDDYSEVFSAGSSDEVEKIFPAVERVG